jgi:hypothetical protein
VGNSVAEIPGHNGKPRRGRRLPAAKKVERDRAIVIDRNKGFTWPEIARRHGLQERQARNVYREWREDKLAEEVAPRDASEWLFEALSMYQQIISTLAQTADDADNDAARVGALRTQMAAMDRHTELLLATGRLPRSLQASIDRQQVQVMIRRMAEVLERHDVQPEVIRDLLTVIDADDPTVGRPARQLAPARGSGGRT